MEYVKLPVERRDQKGTAHSRRLRRTGRFPAVLYGLGKENADLSIGVEDFLDFVKTGSRLVELRLGDQTQRAFLHDVQHDPLDDRILHVDLVRVDETHEIEAAVPVEFKGVAKGLSQGGVFEAILPELRVRCTPSRLPKSFVLEVGHLELDQAILVKDLKLPEGVKVLGHKPEDHVCHCVPQKVVVLETPLPAEGAPAEPERIGGKKPEEEAPAEGGAKPAAKKEEKPEKKDEKKEKK